MKHPIPESLKQFLRSVPDEEAEELARYLNLELKAQTDVLTFLLENRKLNYNPWIGSRAT